MPPVFLLGAIVAQAATPAVAGTADLERIRKALAEPPAIVAVGTFDRPVFRVTIQGWKFDHPVWEEPLPPRPSIPIYHFAYLEMVTPEAFRAGTLYPISIRIPIGTIIDTLGKKISAARRRRAEAHALAEVTEALNELLACRADPSRPGC
jgi:hypothetical protein